MMKILKLILAEVTTHPANTNSALWASVFDVKPYGASPLKFRHYFISAIFKTRIKIGGVGSFEKFPETGILYITIFLNFTFWCT